jgi:hypothetical protein
MEDHRTAPLHSLGELCAGADSACAQGDLETLGHLAGRLAELSREHPSLHHGLTELRRLCRSDAERAMRMWMRLKRQLTAPMA